MDKDIKSAAQFYIDQGFRPLPIFSVDRGCMCSNQSSNCIKNQCFGKVPSIQHWPDKNIEIDLFKDTDNLALIMGKQTDGRWFLGIDIDGDFELSDVLQFPQTLQCKTSRGKHLIFQVEEDSALGNWNDIFATRDAKKEYKYGFNGAVDLRYSRGALVSPPSRTKDGSIYEWDTWMQPAELDRYEIQYLIRMHKKNYPNVKTYRKWSHDPLHKGKKP